MPAAVLDCGTKMCGNTKGAKQQACLCKNCAAQNKAAEKTSCACGLKIVQSKAACQIYERLNKACSGASHTTVGVFAIFTALLVGLFGTH